MHKNHNLCIKVSNLPSAITHEMRYCGSRINVRTITKWSDLKGSADTRSNDTVTLEVERPSCDGCTVELRNNARKKIGDGTNTATRNASPKREHATPMIQWRREAVAIMSIYCQPIRDEIMARFKAFWYWPKLKFLGAKISNSRRSDIWNSIGPVILLS